MVFTQTTLAKTDLIFTVLCDCKSSHFSQILQDFSHFFSFAKKITMSVLVTILHFPNNEALTEMVFFANVSALFVYQKVKEQLLLFGIIDSTNQFDLSNNSKF